MNGTQNTDSERIAVIETTVKDIQTRLLGNGQPGELEKLHKRLTALEQWRSWATGVALGTAFGLGILSVKALEAILK